MWADWKITTVTDTSGRKSVGTEYYKGKLRRSDTQVDGVLRSVFVMDSETMRQTMWDPGAKQYTVFSAARTPSTTKIPVTDTQTRPVLLFESATTDTGERQTFFGRTGRRLITSEKRSREETPGSPRKLESETVTDGWYVDVTGLPQSRSAGLFYSLVAGPSPVIKVTHTGERLSGLAVREKVVTHFMGSGSGIPESEMTREVTELYEGVLPQNLFEPPADFKRVAQLANTSIRYPRSFSDEIELYWNTVERWFAGWFS